MRFFLPGSLILLVVSAACTGSADTALPLDIYLRDVKAGRCEEASKYVVFDGPHGYVPPNQVFMTDEVAFVAACRTHPVLDYTVERHRLDATAVVVFAQARAQIVMRGDELLRRQTSVNVRSAGGPFVDLRVDGEPTRTSALEAVELHLLSSSPHTVSVGAGAWTEPASVTIPPEPSCEGVCLAGPSLTLRPAPSRAALRAGRQAFAAWRTECRAAHWDCRPYHCVFVLCSPPVCSVSPSGAEDDRVSIELVGDPEMGQASPDDNDWYIDFPATRKCPGQERGSVTVTMRFPAKGAPTVTGVRPVSTPPS